MTAAGKPDVSDTSQAFAQMGAMVTSHWIPQVIRAAKQCRRGSLPQVLPPTPLDSFLISPAFTAADACVMLDDRSAPASSAADPPRRIVLLVGPEGGFSDAERSRLEGKTCPWVLGGRILRAETAVIVGLTAVHMTWGDFHHIADML